MTQIILSSSVLILAIVLIRGLLGNKISYRLRYGLWLLVAVRLLIPVELPSAAFSVSTFTQAHIEAPASQVTMQPVIGPSYEDIYADVRQELQALAPDTPPVQLDQQAKAETEHRITAPTVGQILLLLWITGIVCTAAWFLLTNLHFSRRAFQSSQPFHVEGCPLPVRICDRLHSPCLVGFLRPVIYLTPECTRSEQDLRNVLAHELTHWQHKDPWWALVRCVCLCVYWFHPLVWLAAWLSRRDCELACDEGALKHLGEEHRLEYGRTLLNIVSANSGPGSLLQTSTSMNDSKKQLTQRIRFIASHPRRSIAAVVVLLLITVAIVGCTFAGAKETLPESTVPSVPEPEPTVTSPVFTDPTEPQQTLPMLYGAYLTQLSDGNLICIRLPDLQNAQLRTALLSELEERLNTLFEGSAAVIPSDTPVSTENTTAYRRSLTLDHEITYQTENLISIVFRGMYNAGDAAHPTNILFSVNLSPKTGQRIYLRNLYSINQALYADFSASATQTLLAQMDGQWPEIWGSFSESFCDWEQFRLGMYREDTFSWYCTPEGITISYTVPHALGDHQETTLSFTSFHYPKDTLHPLYEIALADYRNIVNYRLSPEYDSNDFQLTFSEELLSALDYVALVLTRYAGLGDHDSYATLILDDWYFMIHEMLPANQVPSIDAFGYALWDMNGDGTPELFWMRNDGYILAVFTVYQDELILLRSSYSRGYVWISEEYRLACQVSGGAATTSIAVDDLKEYIGAMIPVTVKGIYSDYDELPSTDIIYYEILEGEYFTISEERFYTLLEELQKQVPITNVATFHPLFEGYVLPNSINTTINSTHRSYMLTDEDAAQLMLLFQSNNRTPENLPEGNADCFISLANQPAYIYHYYPSSGILVVGVIASNTEYVEQANPVCGKLSESDRILVNDLLSKYIDLSDEVTDIAQPSLSMETVKDLAKRYTQDLTWEHFSAYDSESVGSGLRILHYPIPDSLYCLMIGGTYFDETPLYIRLVLVSDSSKYIDIRYESINAFLNSNSDAVTESTGGTIPEIEYYDSPIYYRDCSLIIYGKKIKGADHIEYVKQGTHTGYISLPFLTVLQELGAKITSISAEETKISYGGKNYILNTKKATFTEEGHDFNFIIPAPGAQVYHYTAENEFYLDDITLRSILQYIGLHIQVKVDTQSRCVIIE